MYVYILYIFYDIYGKHIQIHPHKFSSCNKQVHTLLYCSLKRYNIVFWWFEENVSKVQRQIIQKSTKKDNLERNKKKNNTEREEQRK